MIRCFSSRKIILPHLKEKIRQKKYFSVYPHYSITGLQSGVWLLTDLIDENFLLDGIFMFELRE